MNQGFVYRWTNLINGNWYIGSHLGHKDDGYIGSGRTFLKAIKKYGIQNFKRDILYSGLKFREEEQRTLVELNAANDPKSYNHKNEAFGARLYGEKNGMFGKNHTNEARYKIGLKYRGKKRPEHSEKMKGDKNPTWGKSDHSYGLKRRAENLKGKTYEEIYGKEKAKQLKNQLSLSQKKVKNRDWKFVICPNCDLRGRGPNMSRYHFDKCDKKRKELKFKKEIRKKRKIERARRCTELFQKGMTIEQLATYFKCSITTIYRELKSKTNKTRIFL